MRKLWTACFPYITWLERIRLEQITCVQWTKFVTHTCFFSVSMNLLIFEPTRQGFQLLSNCQCRKDTFHACPEASLPWKSRRKCCSAQSTGFYIAWAIHRKVMADEQFLRYNYQFSSHVHFCLLENLFFVSVRTHVFTFWQSVLDLWSLDVSSNWRKKKFHDLFCAWWQSTSFSLQLEYAHAYTYTLHCYNERIFNHRGDSL